MIDNTLNEMFSEILDLVILIDGVPYAPLVDTISTMFTCAYVIGFIFAFCYLVVRVVGDLLCAAVYDLREFLKKRKQSKQLEG